MKSRKEIPDLSLEERQELYRLRKGGYGIREIARKLSRSASTVSTELGRHRHERGWCERPWYEQARLAHDAAKARRGRPRERGWGLKNETIRSFVHKSIQDKLSPKTVSRLLPNSHPGESISHESIYQYIYKQERTLLEHLVHYGKTKRTKRGSKYCSRQRAAELAKLRIDMRAEQANSRAEFGHQESDFIVSARGGKSCLMVIVERKHRYIHLRKTPNREADVTRRTMFQVLRTLPPCARRSLTIDNDTAHNDLPALEKNFDDFKVYWCYPYRAWERGTVEAINGILRRWFPKGTNFDEVSDEKVAYVERWFNNRPMEVLDGQTPKEAFEKELKLAA